MSKSIKLKNDMYWDSTGIVHNKKILSIILENKQDKWQTIWEGSATTGNTISTGVDFTNIKGIRFKDNKSNCWHEANIDSFLSGSEMAWGIIYNHFEAVLTRFYDVALRMDDKTAGSIYIGRCGYVFEYATDNRLTFNNNSNVKITTIQVLY